ncbi:hypothetical protein QTH87_23600 [Variovorax sp. J22P168]|uniref:hypothetical protein n=1 Tax=Variovorax jilinensis TaxID=3053513 RepID=UPI002576F288|nr:hypothetical protein [Variovorax sp. J22P168]MDM0015449.1 hypothetical protein [Variovorax sp. J22P168]
MSPVLSIGLIGAFGIATLAVVFGLCLLTVVFSSSRIEEGDDVPDTETQRAALGV